ncbi:hypothetical protein DT73_01225 [Mangrovibacter sp. MFB070]|uniref:AraC family transcriptional regulator n=1 Tax=Mangrovibacter sp. MFB070 TaxID=1224318 RepID=UPI0004D3B8DE|nr:AraC family transcriptional regulator [Mangrovibacter sp. MFB070]KEA54526.1 hypothetical protein DT73_01225 [Mangrovibacter sp. MFB070]
MIKSTEPLNHTAKHHTPSHRHSTGQLYWVTRGIIMIEAEHMHWAVTPGVIGWIPAEILHSAWMPVDARGEILHCSPTGTLLLPLLPCIRSASPFLQLLLQKVSERVPAGVHSPYLMHLEQVLVDEIEQATPALSQLSLPADARAKQVAQFVLAGTGDVLSQSVMAKQAGLSVRTLSRLFMQQTGLTFSQWKQKARVLRSLEFLQSGTPVSQAALLVGYENVSAFIVVFRRFMGMTPGQFQVLARC